MYENSQISVSIFSLKPLRNVLKIKLHDMTKKNLFHNVMKYAENEQQQHKKDAKG